MPGKDEVKIHDISASGGAKSRLVVNNRPLNVESTEETESSPKAESDLTAVHRNVIEPLSKTEEAGAIQDQESQETPSEEVAAEPTPEEPTQDQLADTSTVGDRPADSIGDDSVSDDDESDDAETGDKTAKQDKDKVAADAARAEQLATYEAMAASGKYYLPIKTSNERRWVTFLLILIVILLALVALDLLLDADILKINNFSPPTHFFD
jgi:hypothetical protein